MRRNIVSIGDTILDADDVILVGPVSKRNEKLTCQILGFEMEVQLKTLSNKVIIFFIKSHYNQETAESERKNLFKRMVNGPIC
jgi:hypothetical protein